MKENGLNIVYQFNEKYVPYAGVSVTSLFVNNTDAEYINVFVLGDGLSEYSKQLLSETAGKYGRNVYFPDTSKLLGRFEELGMIPYRGTCSVYLRLFFAELLPKDIKRVIYMDADTIVNGILLPLADHDLGEKSIGMVLESITDRYKVMIGMSPESEYYNSGMILFDVARWVANGYSDRILEHARNVRSSYIGDQDFINIVCEGDICRLSPKYNFQPLHSRYSIRQYYSCYGKNPYYSPSEVEEASADPVIYHCYRWLGTFPWNVERLHPFTKIFDRYLAMSLWSNLVKESSEGGVFIGIERILYRILPKWIFIRVFKLSHEVVLYKSERDARQHRANSNS